MEPPPTLTLTLAQVEELRRHLGELRHDVNNALAQITAATEIIQTKPDLSPRMTRIIIEQPKRIVDEMQRFAREFDAVFGQPQA